MSRRFSIEVEKDYFNFASAHFLIFADGTRETLHGHNYQVSVAIEGDLDSAGVLLNFITFKPLVKEVCDGLDHRTLLPGKNPGLKTRQVRKNIEVLYKDERFLIPRRDVILLPLINTSSELLAEYVARKIWQKAHVRFPGAKLDSIEVCIEEARGQKGLFRGEFPKREFPRKSKR
ncbi:MAG: 6-pyruvoyl tetrahydropterin synthase family protein [Candidatus Binatia bacterium]